MNIGLKAFLTASTALCALPSATLAQPADARPAEATSESVTSVTGVTGAAPASSATAAATAAAGEVAQATTTAPGEIIVTATRRASSIQKVPVTMDVASASKLDALSVTNSQGIEKIVSGVTVAVSGGVTPFIRGIGTFNAGFSEASVAVYIDGIFLPNSAGALFSFNNIERIEVLKGPQGTLYGRNVTGGLINVITKEPSQEAAMNASVGYANYNTFTQNFYGSAPISKTLSANVAVYHQKQADGWSKNITTGNDVQKSEDTAIYGKLKWEPGSDTKVILSGLYNFSDSSKGFAFSLVPGTFGLDGTNNLGEYRIANRSDPKTLTHGYLASLRIDQDLGFANLFSITAYQYGKQLSRLTQNGIPGNAVAGQSAQNTFIDFNYNTFSQELNLSSKTDGPFTWLLGAFYYHDNTNVATALTSTCIGAVCAPVAGGVPRLTHTRPTTRSYSGYADGTYTFRETTHLTLGVRYTYEKKGFGGFSEPLLGLPNSVPAAPIVLPLATLDTSRTFPKVTYRAVLAQDFTDNFRGFVSYNRGFKSGNFNPNSLTNAAVKPEILDSFEAGVKSELFDRKLRFNVSGFYYNYKDIQVRSNAGQPIGAPSIALNVASAHTKGVDSQIDYAPFRGFSIGGGLSYIDAKYQDFPGDTCVAPRTPPFATGVRGGGIVVPCSVANPTNFKGNRLPLSPKWSGNLTASYALETEAGTFTLVGNGSFKSRFFFAPEGGLTQSAYRVVDSSLTWSSPDKKFDIKLFMNNIFDKYRFQAGQATINGFVYVPAEPRTYGIVAGVQF